MGNVKLNPSAAGVWVHCPGSIKMKKMYPSPVNPVALEGTHSHAIAASLFTGNAVPEKSEAFEMAMEYYQYYAPLLTAENGVEEMLSMTGIHPDMRGICDLWYRKDGETIVVVDYKYGRGVVEAEENFQLVSYAMSDKFTDCKKFELHIYQPRTSEPVKVWIADRELLEKYAIMMKFAAQRAQGENPEVKAGSHCQYCSAMLHCKSNKATINGILNRAVPYDLQPEQMGREYSILKSEVEILQYRLKALESEMIGMLLSGKRVPGYTTKQTQGRLAWKVADSLAIEMAGMLGVNIAKTTDPVAITPLQAIKAGVPEEIVMELAARGNGSIVLTEVFHE